MKVLLIRIVDCLKDLGPAVWGMTFCALVVGGLGVGYNCATQHGDFDQRAGIAGFLQGVAAVGGFMTAILGPIVQARLKVAGKPPIQQKERSFEQLVKREILLKRIKAMTGWMAALMLGGAIWGGCNWSDLRPHQSYAFMLPMCGTYLIIFSLLFVQARQHCAEIARQIDDARRQF